MRREITSAGNAARRDEVGEAMTDVPAIHPFKRTRIYTCVCAVCGWTDSVATKSRKSHEGSKAHRDAVRGRRRADMEGLQMEVTCGACPMQIEGEIDGVAFYLRSRGERWRMGIGGDVVMHPLWSMGGPWGDGPFATGYMPEEIATSIVMKCCELWRVAR
jgi:hypothetical protein